MKVRNKEGFLATLTVFRNSLHSLVHPGLLERGRIVAQPAQDSREDWGHPADLTQLDVKW